MKINLLLGRLLEVFPALNHKFSKKPYQLILMVFLSIPLAAFSPIAAETDSFLRNISYGTDTTYIEIPFLIVNTHPLQRTIIKKNESLGQKDIQDLLKYVTHEEKWIYLPDRKLWIEMGIQAKKIDETRRFGFQVFSSMKEIKKIFLTEKKLIDYHFHPDSCHFTDSKANAFLKKANINTIDKNLDLIKANYFLPVQHICSAMPGRDDLLQLLVASSLFYQIHPDGDFRHKVMSHFGTTTYAIKGNKKQIIKNFTLEEAEVVANKLASCIDQYIDCKLILKHNDIQDKDTGIKIIRQTVRRLNYLEMVQLEFTPHQEFQ